ncbi:2Fe-2S iron-sulfur cluster-binding protein [Pedobacter montanisoli]|uniref:2Fe-2S iron-sulfur cluster-binding protein n=1 Tax=Pedobacter montanisoli TaxID=2923277 RepID=A0ABS9ZTJ2_9SPHI|nr:2Fe-2S iron-sulfur cluster-binding protein [Pedobacter montanisoli]MCJ0741901.1 2Fe-2S iron-sulfur cluster-binding protein [Pedobacter montanisoli]
MATDITIHVEDREGNTATLSAPTDMGLSLMEFLKASEYDILATCGGMALCATCCVDIMEGEEKLNEMSDDEYAMLDTLPDVLPNSRLACQIQLSPEYDGLRVRLHAMDN